MINTSESVPHISESYNWILEFLMKDKSLGGWIVKKKILDLWDVGFIGRVERGKN